MFVHEKDGVSQFNRHADRYDRYLARTGRRTHSLVIRQLTRGFTTPMRVLDVGSGTGTLLDKLSSELPKADLFGADPAQRMLDIAKRKVPQADLTVAAAEALPYPDDHFQLVVSSEAFGHWRDQKRGLSEIRRVLAPEGRAVIVEHAPPGWLKRGIFYVAGALPRYQAADTIAIWAKDAQFDNVETHNAHGYVTVTLAKGFE